ncbi:MAG: hypothetical protein AB7K71_27580 [Polyangiaceae bacterium]
MTNVDWENVQDAFGPAKKIPALIKALDTKRADISVEELRDRLAHQGWATPASVPGIEALLEWLWSGKGEPHIRAEIIALTADLVSGGDHLRALSRGEPAKMPWSSSTQARVLALLEDAQAEVRAAGGLLCAVALPRTTSGPTVEGWFQREKHKSAKASALLAVGFSGAQLPSEKAVGKALVPLLCLATLFHGGELSDEQLQQLVDMVAKRRDFKGVYWSGDQLWALAQQCLLTYALSHGATQWLWSLLDASPNAAPIARSILEQAFPPRDAGELLSADELTGAQQATLSGLMERNLVQRWATPILFRHGLMDDPQLLKRQLEGRHGPLDSKVDGEPLWRIANRAALGRVKPEAWIRALKQAHAATEPQLQALEECVLTYPIGLIFPAEVRVESLRAALELVAGSIAKLIEDPAPLLERELPATPKAREWRLAVLWAIVRGANRGLSATEQEALKALLAAVNDRQAEAAAAVLRELPIEQREALVREIAFRQGYDSTKREPWVKGGWWFLEAVPTHEFLERAAQALSTCPVGKAPVDVFRRAVDAGGERAKAWLDRRLAAGDETASKLVALLEQS